MLIQPLNAGEKYLKTVSKRPCPKTSGYLNWSLETLLRFSVARRTFASQDEFLLR
jgi:hypothetical protein